MRDPAGQTPANIDAPATSSPLSISIAAAYDAIAPEYDRQLGDDVWMRQLLWKRYERAFCPGHHVLDVGCGTGTDAVFLAQRGVRVTGIDISPGMIAQAERKVAHYGLSQEVRFAVLDVADLAALIETQRGGAAGFDGIISSFAALNVLPSLDRFAADAASLLRPLGRMILHLLGGSSLWERAGLVAHGQWAEARQLGRGRERTLRVGGQPLQHYLPRTHELYAHSFAPYFRLCSACSLGITQPPDRMRHVPAVVLTALARLDERIGSHRPWVDWGRFAVLELARHSDEAHPSASA